MIKLDGKNYKLNVIDVGLDVEFLYKYARRTEDFNMNYELGAVFYNQQITVGTEDSNNPDFVEFVKVLSTKSKIDNGTGHQIEIRTPMGMMSFLMYPDKLTMKLFKQRDERTWWQNLVIKFIAVKPVEAF